jgi:pimeloyl-ACP methyl ester carboxylesterase
VVDSQSIAIDWYYCSGAARTAVYVHGIGSHRRGEKAEYFASRFNAHGWNFASVDLRGHGESDGRIFDLTMSGMLTDLGAALEWIGSQQVAGRPVLIGASMGGAVIAWYALQHPATAGPLIMLAPALQFPFHLPSLLTAAEMQEWRRTGARRWRSEWIDLDIGYELMRDAVKYDPVRLRAELRAALFILHGMQDTALDWRASVAFAENCSADVDLMLIQQGDHRLTEQKTYLFDVLWAWLAKAKP